MSDRESSEAVDLTIPLKTLAYIITKAREYDAEVDPVDENSGSNPTDDDALGILEARKDNPTRGELVSAIEGLNDDERIELLALAWVGRGDFTAAEWDGALQLARERHDRKEAEYLASTPLLGDYLSEALNDLGYSDEELEEAGE